MCYYGFAEVDIMEDLARAINNMISISSFNKGQAGKIFEQVRKSGTKIVVKNNNPECVLISPEAYIELMDLIDNLELQVLANEREKQINPGNLLTEPEVLEKLGLTKEDLDGVGEVEIE